MRSSSQPSWDWKAACGTLAAVLTLALSLPGVSVVRAADGDEATSTALVDQAEVCDTASDPGPDLTMELLLERQRRLAPPTDEEAAERPVVLNNRGYNYGPPPTIDPSLYKRARN